MHMCKIELAKRKAHSERRKKMKKAMVLVAVIGLILVCSVAVYAGAEKIVLVPTTIAATFEDGIHANASGFMVINETPKGATDIVIQIQVKDAAPQYEYVVKSGGVVRGTFTTNKIGNGGGHVNLPPDAPALGGTAVNVCAPDASNTKLLRAYF